MIIEFNGLPGTGKTTVCRALADRITGKRKFTFRRELRESRLKRYISYLTDGSLPLYRLSVRFSDSLCKNAGDGIEVIKKNRGLAFRLVRLYRSYLAFYREAQGDEIMLLDEGILHGLLTLAHGREISDASLLDGILLFLKKKGISFACINCFSDVALSSARIAGRGDTGARLDACDPAERERVLSVQKRNLEIIRERAGEILSPVTVGIDTSEDVEKNASYIDERLLLSGGGVSG